MFSLAKKASFAAVLLGAMAAPGRAQSESLNFDYYCSMGSMAVCASVRIQSIDDVLTMQVWNLNGTLGDPHAITDIGLYHAATDWTGDVTGSNVAYVTGSGSEDISAYWSAFAAGDLSDPGGINLELADGTWFGDLQGITGCTDTGSWLVNWSTCGGGASSFPGTPYVEFTFNLSTHYALNDLRLRWKSYSLATQSDVTCDTGGAGDMPACRYRTPPTTAPEPGTIALVGTGLLSIAGFVRRRRKNS